jgi:hypothetical protein
MSNAHRISNSRSHTSGQEELEAPSNSIKRKPQWIEQTLRDAQEHVEAPKSTFKESRPPKRCFSYMAVMSSIIDFEPTNVEEASDRQF